MTWQLKPATGQGTDGEVRGDFRLVCDSAEDLLRATADLGGERFAALRERVDQALKNVKTRVSETHEELVDRARTKVRAADSYVHENPWRTVGIAAGVGLIVGVLLSRRSAEA